jgi:hypothetical protein
MTTEKKWCILPISMTVTYQFIVHRRALKHGTTIISTPLILTWGDSPMKMRTGRSAVPEGINTRLILENYQFKHPSADVYFLPITQVTAINHGSPRKESRNPPNAKIQWAQWHRKSVYYLQRPLDDLRNVSGFESSTHGNTDFAAHNVNSYSLFRSTTAPWFLT